MCLIAIATTCLLAKEGLYVQMEAALPYDDVVIERSWCKKDNYFCSGPLGRLRIGMTVEINSQLRLDYGWEHQSYIMMKDRGMESVFTRLEWRPFR